MALKDLTLWSYVLIRDSGFEINLCCLRQEAASAAAFVNSVCWKTRAGNGNSRQEGKRKRGGSAWLSFRGLPSVLIRNNWLRKVLDGTCQGVQPFLSAQTELLGCWQLRWKWYCVRTWVPSGVGVWSEGNTTSRSLLWSAVWRSSLKRG